MESGSPASQADSLPSRPLGNPGEPPTNECLSVHVLSSCRAYMSVVLPFAWKPRCVCVPRALYNQQNQVAKPAIFFFKSVEYSVICVYKKVSLKQDRNELEKTIVYMVDTSP